MLALWWPGGPALHWWSHPACLQFSYVFVRLGRLVFVFPSMRHTLRRHHYAKRMTPWERHGRFIKMAGVDRFWQSPAPGKHALSEQKRLPSRSHPLPYYAPICTFSMPWMVRFLRFLEETSEAPAQDTPKRWKMCFTRKERAVERLVAMIK